MLWACFLDFVNALAGIASAVAVYPVVKRVNESMALGFVMSRMVEAAVIVIGVVSLLTVVVLRQDFAGTASADVASLTTTGQALVTGRDWTFLLGPGFMACVNAVLFGTLMYRSRLVPRWIPTVGLIGAPLLFTANLLTFFGHNSQTGAWTMLATLPIATWELSVGFYMAFKGFKASPYTDRPRRLTESLTHGRGGPSVADPPGARPGWVRVGGPTLTRCRSWAPSCTSRPLGVGSWTGRAWSTGCGRTRAAMPRLVLVSAPAGFGKTTLMSQWLATSGPTVGEGATDVRAVAVAWLSLDAGDSDPRQFLTHLVAALQDRRARGRRRRPGPLEVAPGLPTTTSLVSLVNDLDALAGPTVVALDDYHVVDSTAVHEAVSFLLDNLPPQVTLAITTRADPPLPRLAAAGPRRARRAPRRRPPLHDRRGGGVPQRRDGARPAARARRRPRVAHRGMGRRAPAGRAVGTRAATPTRTSAVSSTRSRAATVSSWTTSSRRCSTASRTTCARSSSTPRCSTS